MIVKLKSPAGASPATARYNCAATVWFGCSMMASRFHFNVPTVHVLVMFSGWVSASPTLDMLMNWTAVTFLVSIPHCMWVGDAVSLAEDCIVVDGCGLFESASNSMIMSSIAMIAMKPILSVLSLMMCHAWSPDATTL